MSSTDEPGSDADDPDDPAAGSRPTEGPADHTTNHAAIDIGTNSVHLLVAAVGGDGEFTVLTTDKETVRLGDSPGDIRLLSEDAMQRGVDALQRFKAIADSFDASVYAVATSAVREATNGTEFVKRAAAIGVDVNVISGPEEARLIHLGILQALPIFDQQLIMVDIGGGSTEFLVGKSGKSLGARSLRIGHLRLTNRFFPEGTIDDESLAACRVYVRSFLVPAVTDLKRLGFQVAIGSSGTAEAIGDMIRLRSHGGSVGAGLDTVITGDGLDDLLDELTQWTTAQERLEHVAGLADKRADVIVAGAILLDEIFRAFEIERMVTSPYALREGVLLDRTLGIETGRHRLADLRRDSLMRMVEAYEEDQPHVLHATELALDLYDQLADLHGLSPTDRELLEAAGLLHNVGLFVSHAAHHQHSDYIIRNSDRLTGYTEREIDVIAQVARYHRRSAPKKSHPRYMALSRPDRRRVQWLAGMLRIAIALDRTRSSVVEATEIVAGKGKKGPLQVVAKVAAGADATVECFTANNRCGLLGTAAGRDVTVVVEEMTGAP